jgi:hypothetical protein
MTDVSDIELKAYLDEALGYARYFAKKLKVQEPRVRFGCPQRVRWKSQAHIHTRNDILFIDGKKTIFHRGQICIGPKCMEEYPSGRKLLKLMAHEISHMKRGRGKTPKGRNRGTLGHSKKLDCTVAILLMQPDLPKVV